MSTLDQEPVATINAQQAPNAPVPESTPQTIRVVGVRGRCALCDGPIFEDDESVVLPIQDELRVHSYSYRWLLKGEPVHSKCYFGPWGFAPDIVEKENPKPLRDAVMLREHFDRMETIVSQMSSALMQIAQALQSRATPVPAPKPKRHWWQRKK